MRSMWLFCFLAAVSVAASPLDDAAAALKARDFKLAQALYATLLDAGCHAEAEALRGLGRAALGLGQVEKSLDYFRTALHAGGTPESRAKIFSSFAVAIKTAETVDGVPRVPDAEAALAYASQIDLNAVSPSVTFNAVHNIVILSQSLGRHAEAASALDKLLPLAATSQDRIGVHLLQGQHLLQVGRYADSVKPLQAAISGLPATSSETASALHAYGVALMHLDRPQDAISFLRRSLKADPGASPQRRAERWEHIALAEQEALRIQASLTSYRTALRLYRGDTVGDNPLMVGVLNNVGILFDALGQLGRAEAYYRRAAAQLDKLPPGSHKYAGNVAFSRGLLLARRNRPIDSAEQLTTAQDLRSKKLLAAALHGDEQEMLRLLPERQKLNDTVRSLATGEFKGNPQFTRLLLHNLATESSQIARLLRERNLWVSAGGLSPSLSAELRDVRTEIFHGGVLDRKRLQRLNALDASLTRAWFASGAAARPLAHRPPLDPALLPPGTHIVNYFSFHRYEQAGIDINRRRKELHFGALVLSRSGIKVTDLGPAAPTAANAIRLHRTIANRRPDFAEPCSRAYDQLLRPLFGGNVPKHLILIPDAELHLVPFAALLSAPGRYLVHDSRLSIGGSAASALQSHSTPLPTGFRSISAIVDPEYYSVVPRLEGSAEEESAVRRFFPRHTVYSGPVANKSAIEKAASSDLLLIDAHAAAGTLQPLLRTPLPPEYSALILFSSGDPARPAAGVLSARELAFLDLHHVRLLILAGCHTASGSVPTAEALAGLRRAAFVAGSGQVLANLWQVDDPVHAGLVASLLEKISQSLSSPAAEHLRFLQVQLVGKYHPYHWAGTLFAGL